MRQLHEGLSFNENLMYFVLQGAVDRGMQLALNNI